MNGGNGKDERRKNCSRRDFGGSFFLLFFICDIPFFVNFDEV